MQSKWIQSFVFFLVLFLSSQLHASSEFLAEVESRHGVKQKYIIIKPDQPSAAVILFEGAHGGLDMYATFSKPGLKWGANGFLARTRQSFAKQGFVVTLIDSPPDKKKMDAIWRMGPEHAEDILSVIKAIKTEYNVPIWVVGMSMGTFSAANAAIRLSSEVDGLVLISSITRSPKKWEIYPSHPKGIINMSYDKLLTPALIVSHKEDGCVLSPAEDAPTLKGALKNSQKVEVLSFTGGKKAESKPCESLSAHGFYGIEEKVVSSIADFIKTNSK
jgi:dienelactone hydrolase